MKKIAFVGGVVFLGFGIFAQELQHQVSGVNVEIPVSVSQSTPSELAMVERSEDIFSAFDEVAQATGGTTDSSANAAASFKRAVDASENYYLIYYKPPNYKADGQFHEIKVSVKTGNYRLTHRAGYIAK